ncbi:MAG TPA: tripartite tricarboxylate transporter substrate binding protein [Ramlibacter sp.]|nr:tripartite tricarboxylate transporter substrate binding protein [Ramlibacter sp.]
MPRNIRRLTLAALLAGVVSLPAAAQAPAWPQKPIRLLVAAPAGSAPDLIARIIGDKLGKALAQPVLIDNKPGAGGIVAMNLLKSAPADGYTLALPQAAVVVVTPHTYKEASYDAERDFQTIAMVGKTPMMFVANMAHPAKTFADAVSMAKAKPDQVSVGNPTRTSIPHLAAELVGMKTDAKFQQVSFANTGQGLQAVVNGDIALYTDGVGPLLQLVKAGKLRPLAVASETELPGLEGLPLANKTVPGLNVYGWFILQAPRGTPAPVVQRLNAEVNKAMGEADVVARFREFGTYPTPGTVADAERFLTNEKALFSGVIRTLGLKPE